MSDPARRALVAAVRLNPDAALRLRAILRTASEAVKYKPEDPLGPLGMLVVGAEEGPIVPRRFRSLKRPALPRHLRTDAMLFRDEWLARRFSKHELAEDIEACLRALGENLPAVEAPWRQC